jgi:hypothetical protein
MAKVELDADAVPMQYFEVHIPMPEIPPMQA